MHVPLNEIVDIWHRLARIIETVLPMNADRAEITISLEVKYALLSKVSNVRTYFLFEYWYNK